MYPLHEEAERPIATTHPQPRDRWERVSEQAEKVLGELGQAVGRIQDPGSEPL